MDKKINYKLLEEMIRCVKREINYRNWVYPKRVEAGKMAKDNAEKEIKLMSAVHAALQKIYDDNAPTYVQQSFLNAQDFMTKEYNYL